MAQSSANNTTVEHQTELLTHFYPFGTQGHLFLLLHQSAVLKQLL